MTGLTVADERRLTRRALRLARLTVAWNVVEGAVAVTAGLTAGLVSVVGFGVDSGIESVAAVLVGLRLAARLRGDTADEAAERRTLRAVAVTFFVLAAWITLESVRGLVWREAPDTSTVGLVLLAVSLVVMPVLAEFKRRVGVRLGDRLVLADAAETRVCALLSASTLVALVAHALTGAAWLDPVAGLVIAAFAVHEGREAWEGALVEDDEDDAPGRVGAPTAHRGSRAPRGRG